MAQRSLESERCTFWTHEGSIYLRVAAAKKGTLSLAKTFPKQGVTNTDWEADLTAIQITFDLFRLLCPLAQICKMLFHFRDHEKASLQVKKNSSQRENFTNFLVSLVFCSFLKQKHCCKLVQHILGSGFKQNLSCLFKNDILC